MKRARYEILPEDRVYFGEIPGFQGVWAEGKSLEACRTEDFHRVVRLFPACNPISVREIRPRPDIFRQAFNFALQVILM